MTDDPIVLWPDGAPDAKAQGEADVPALTPFAPEPGTASNSAMIVCAGANYGNPDIAKAGQTAE